MNNNNNSNICLLYDMTRFRDAISAAIEKGLSERLSWESKSPSSSADTLIQF